MTCCPRFALRLCLPAFLLAVSGCGPGRNEFAPACPVARLVPTLADLSRYAADDPAPGRAPSHDVTALILEARVVKVDGSCAASDSATTLAATVQVSVAVQRGPAMRGREAEMPVFVAVADGGTVRDKQVFPVHVVFPPNVDRLTITSPPIDMSLPVTPDVGGSAYRIIAGFQLSPDELAAYRQGPRG